MRKEFLMALLGSLVLLFGSSCGGSDDGINCSTGNFYFRNVPAGQCEKIVAQVEKAISIFTAHAETALPPRAVWTVRNPSSPGASCAYRDYWGRHVAGWTESYVNGASWGEIALGENLATGEDCTVHDSAIAHEILHAVDPERFVCRDDECHNNWLEKGWFQLIEESRI